MAFQRLDGTKVEWTQIARVNADGVSACAWQNYGMLEFQLGSYNNKQTVVIVKKSDFQNMTSSGRRVQLAYALASLSSTNLSTVSVWSSGEGNIEISGIPSTAWYVTVLGI